MNRSRLVRLYLPIENMRRLSLSLVFIISVFSGCRAETAEVKYRGPVDLAPFACTAIERSSFIRRVCYDRSHAYMIVSLNGTYYHYCDIDSATVDSFVAADSMGRFYNATIKGHFDCRTGHVPPYGRK
ncbi:MAG TPA: KTSC domain-containing protein [Xanthobacteraceae bacterium]|nr:KTSC domain-containing protein [Xanthobacteraceae bacterium]